MESPWLYDTAVPVLLGTAVDSPAAGRLARRLFRRHQVMCWWFGQRLSLSLILYTRHRPVSLGTLNDRLRVRALRDFAAAPEQSGKLLALIPARRAPRHSLPAGAGSWAPIMFCCPVGRTIRWRGS